MSKALTPLVIKDTWRTFRFLFTVKERDGNPVGVLYIPDYNPTVFNIHPDVRLTMMDYHSKGKPVFAARRFIDARPCSPFRAEGQFYKCCWEYEIPSENLQLILDFGEIVDDVFEVSADWTNCQGAWVNLTDPLTLPTPEIIGKVDDKYKIHIPINMNNVKEILKESYCVDEVITTIDAKIIGAEDIYWNFGNPIEVDDGIDLELETDETLTNFHYKEEYGIIYSLNAVLKYNNDPKSYGMTDEEFKENERYKNIIVMKLSNLKMILPRDWAKLIATQTDIDELYNSDMELKEFRLINKTIQNVVNITGSQDTKANIIQPIFFRVRDVESVVIHPAVTENICINLDAYKSSCQGFFLQFEGISFPEIGRTEAGVVFKIYGNMLPGKINAGVYYVLNQSGDLVTSGKYIYEV